MVAAAAVGCARETPHAVPGVPTLAYATGSAAGSRPAAPCSTKDPPASGAPALVLALTLAATQAMAAEATSEVAALAATPHAAINPFVTGAAASPVTQDRHAIQGPLAAAEMAAFAADAAACLSAATSELTRCHPH